MISTILLMYVDIPEISNLNTLHTYSGSFFALQDLQDLFFKRRHRIVSLTYME